MIAIDPTSPISGGAVLGDRVRMERSIAARPEVFVRSLASRGSVGAVAAATRNVTRLVEATGMFDVVIVETVGAGQTEVAVARLCRHRRARDRARASATPYRRSRPA